MTTSLLRLFIGVLAMGAAALASAAAEYFISYRYDGNYWGARLVYSEDANASCAALPLAHIEIRNGILRAYDELNRQTVKGFVTGDGFFTSDYVFSDGRKTLFEGIVDLQGQFTGGIVDGACAWVVDLEKSQR